MVVAYAAASSSDAVRLESLSGHRTRKRRCGIQALDVKYNHCYFYYWECLRAGEVGLPLVCSCLWAVSLVGQLAVCTRPWTARATPTKRPFAASSHPAPFPKS